MKPTDLKCYPQVVAVIGEALADYELQRVIDCKDCDVGKGAPLIDAFVWDNTPQRDDFWGFIDDGISPYDHGHEKPEVKEWAYIYGEWMHRDNDYYVNYNGVATAHIDEVNGQPAHKSVTMPDWVPESKEWISDNEDKKVRCTHEGVDKIFVLKSESVDKVEPTAASILESGLGHMKDRAVTYDNPQGERSMGKTVDMFNTLYGLELTEEQGWAFMAILKLVRTSQGDFKLDNFEDLAAYAGLMGEAAIELASASE